MTEIQEQETAQPETLLSAEQTLTSAKQLMSETAAVVAKRQGLRVSHFSMDELIDVATFTTFDGEPVCEITNVIGRDGSKTVRRIIYFDRGKRSFELGYRDEKVTDPLSCLLYTSDAADERSSVDLGGRCIFKKKKKTIHTQSRINVTRHSDTHSARDGER